MQMDQRLYRQRLRRLAHPNVFRVIAYTTQLAGIFLIGAMITFAFALAS